jgi:hypothetical protein
MCKGRGYRGRRARAAGNPTGFGNFLGQYCTSFRLAAMLSNPYGIHNQQWGGHVYICTGPRLPWAQVWPLLRHYD